MLATLLSSTLVGLDGRVIRVEVDVAPGLPGFTIVGPRRRRAPGGARARPRRDPQRRLRPSAAADHRQPRPGRPAQGGRLARPRDRDRDPARLGAGARGAGPDRADRRAVARRRGPARARDPADGRGPRAGAGVRRVVVPADVRGGGRARRRDRGRSACATLREAVDAVRRRPRAGATGRAAAGRAGASRRPRPRPPRAGPPAAARSPPAIGRSPGPGRGPRSARGAARRSRSPSPAATGCCSSGRRAPGKTLLARTIPGLLPPLGDARGARGDDRRVGGRRGPDRRRSSGGRRSARRITRCRTRRWSAAGRGCRPAR